MVIVVIKAILLILVIPTLTTIYLKNAEDLKAANATALQKWVTKNWPILPVLVLVGAATWMEAWTYRRTTPIETGEAALTLLPAVTYVQELDAVAAKPADWPTRRQELIRKFEFADYAYNKGDFAKTIEALTELDQGRDSQGSLFRASSCVVSNNLACAYFRRQRNRGFAAARFLLMARDRAAARPSDLQKIDANLDKLDKLVNRLD